MTNTPKDDEQAVDVEAICAHALRVLGEAGVILTSEEEASIEITDFGLGRFHREGLILLTYINTDRYCAKELLLLPGQTCPQHRHPRVDGDPGKQETFRCRRGEVYLYVEGPHNAEPACSAPLGSEEWYTVWHGIRLTPGQQYTIPPDTWHWFHPGRDGALISEFSSTSRDEADVFLDPRVVRNPPRADDRRP